MRESAATRKSETWVIKARLQKSHEKKLENQKPEWPTIRIINK